ncbi:MAG TPA: oligosaccharide flippase family protein [Candidatus Paceibacterota bacterium]|nr:oligosaccharide flippase family protein [Candidatus Paceibacterota bacterium]
MVERLKHRAVSLLRWSEQYVKTDMVYLASVFFWGNITVVTTSVLALLLSIAYANLLPKDVYGTYQYLIALSGLVSAFMLTGMGNAVVQAVARGYEGTLKAGFRAQLKWALVPALVSVGIAVYYFIHGNIEIGLGLLIIAACAPLAQAYGTYGSLLEGKRDFRRLFYFSFIVSTAPYVALLIVLWWVKIPVVLLLVNLGAGALAAIYAYRKTLALYKPNDRVDPKAIPYGRNLSILGAWGSILTQLDSIMVFHFLGPVPLAVYSFATLIPERLGGMFGFVGSASLPKFATQPLSYIQTHISSKILRVVLAGVAATLLYALCAPLFFKLLFPRYIDALQYTELYAPIIVLLAVTGITNSVFYAKRLVREIYLYSIAQPLLLVALQLPLILRWGIGGMVVARLITDIIAVSIMLFFIFRPLSRPESDDVISM